MRMVLHSNNTGGPESGGRLRKLKLAILFVCFLVCVQQSTMLIRDYLYGERWATSITMEDVYLMPIPNVTVCNFNRVNLTRAGQMGINESLMMSYLANNATYQALYTTLQNKIPYISLVDHFFGAILSTISLDTPVRLPLLLQNMPDAIWHQLGRFLYNEFKRDRKITGVRELIHQLSHKCNETAYMCKFKTINFDCCKDSQMLFTEQGNCFTINVPSDPDGARGSQGHDEHHMTSALDNNWELGAVLYLSYEPESSVCVPIAVPTGSHSFINMQQLREQTSTSGSIFAAPCTEAKRTEYLNVSYSRDSCGMDCLAKVAWGNCGCFPNGYTGTNESRCEPDTYYDCYVPKILYNWASNWTGPVGTAISECREKCQTPCMQETVQATISSAKLPNTNLVPQLKQIMQRMQGRNVTADSIRDDILMVDVFFGRLAYTVVERYPKMTIIDLLSNFGGQVGLWLGASVITLYEIIEWMVESHRKVRNRKQSSKVQMLDSKSPIPDMVGRPSVAQY